MFPMTTSTEPVLAKVPEVTLGFWLIKIAATTLGETGGDAVSMSMNLGYLVGTGIFAAVFLVVGCFLDAIPAIIIVGAILQPIAMQAGLHPVHFAMIGIVSLAFGLVTPPYGLCLLISCAVAKMRVVDALKDTGIMLLPMLAVLALLIVWPDMALLLPRLIEPDFMR